MNIIIRRICVLIFENSHSRFCKINRWIRTERWFVIFEILFFFSLFFNEIFIIHVSPPHIHFAHFIWFRCNPIAISVFSILNFNEACSPREASETEFAAQMPFRLDRCDSYAPLGLLTLFSSNFWNSLADNIPDLFHYIFIANDANFSPTGWLNS